MSGGGLADLVLRLVFSLGLVLALVVVAGRVLRNRSGGVALRTRTRIDVLARQPLGRNTSLALVRVSGQALLLGVTDSSVRVLQEVAVEDLPADEPRPGRQTPPSLSAVLDALRERTVRR